MADILTGVIRLLHIISGVAWVGGALFWATIIAPNVLARGPAPIRRPFLEAAIGPITRFFTTASISTIVFGLLLAWRLNPAFALPVWRNWIGAGFVLGVLMAIEGLAITGPSAKRLLAKMQSIQGPPSEADQAQLAAMGKKLGMHGMITVSLGALAVVCMVSAVNVIR